MSHEFTDDLGRVWRLKIDVALHEEVKERTGVLLLSAGDDDCALLGRLHDDLPFIMNVLGILCEDQLVANGVVDDDKSSAATKFAKGFTGDVLIDAVTALVGAVIDFFRSQETRSVLRARMEKAMQVSDSLTRMAKQETESLNPQQVASNYIASCLSSPPSLASTPGDTALVS